MVGTIIKGIAGFYYVHDSQDVYTCKAKGIFRKNHEKPLVGDHVEFDVVSSMEMTGNITSILDRESRLIRPEVANADLILLVFSLAKPEPNYDMLNRFLLTVHDEPASIHFVITKCDLAEKEAKEQILSQFLSLEIPFHFVSSKTGEGLEELKEALSGHTAVLAGPSGVGKSSLLNALLEDEKMETGELSRKIERGKNTTRHAELFYMGESTYLCDTPGFSSVEIPMIEKENLPLYYDEFIPYLTECRFSSCKHLKEPDCKVRDAVRNGKISKSRYLNYVSVYLYLDQLKRY